MFMTVTNPIHKGNAILGSKEAHHIISQCTLRGMNLIVTDNLIILVDDMILTIGITLGSDTINKALHILFRKVSGNGRQELTVFTVRQFIDTDTVCITTAQQVHLLRGPLFEMFHSRRHVTDSNDVIIQGVRLIDLALQGRSSKGKSLIVALMKGYSVKVTDVFNFRNTFVDDTDKFFQTFHRNIRRIVCLVTITGTHHTKVTVHDGSNGNLIAVNIRAVWEVHTVTVTDTLRNGILQKATIQIGKFVTVING